MYQQQNESAPTTPMPQVETQIKPPLTPEQLKEQSIFRTQQEIISRLSYAKELGTINPLSYDVHVVITSGENPSNINQLLELSLHANGQWLDQTYSPIVYNPPYKDTLPTVSNNILEHFARIDDPICRDVLMKNPKIDLISYVKTHRLELLERFRERIDKKLEEVRLGKGIVVVKNDVPE